jgi:MOSC domain-containing protein YiiM
MKILYIQTGQPQTLDIPDPSAEANAAEQPGDNLWRSSIFKSPVAGPVFVGKTNLAGDAQGDQKNHGGPDKAICVYAHEHYAHWQEQFGLAELGFGAFGENFTLQGVDESTLCIGDTLAIGRAGGESAERAEQVIVQVSQPRQPCWKLARRWQIKDFALQVQSIGYTGWYFRVLQEGMVQAGDSLRLIERPYPHLTLAEANRIMHHDKQDWEAIARLLACPLLSASWQKSLRFRLNTRAPADVADRIYGRAG